MRLRWYPADRCVPRGCASRRRPQRTRPCASDLQIPQYDPPEHQYVTILEIRLRDAATVDEGAVGAAVVEYAGARAAIYEDRVAPGDGVLIQAQVGGQAPTDVCYATPQRYQQPLVRPL